jgi:hypothetical protein
MSNDETRGGVSECDSAAGASSPAHRYPKQGAHAGKRVLVMFDYAPRTTSGGGCVRDDVEAPWLTILRLDDGHHVLAGECQYQPQEG